MVAGGRWWALVAVDGSVWYQSWTQTCNPSGIDRSPFPQRRNHRSLVVTSTIVKSFFCLTSLLLGVWLRRSRITRFSEALPNETMAHVCIPWRWRPVGANRSGQLGRRRIYDAVVVGNYFR